jgi:hypothetical protein
MGWLQDNLWNNIFKYAFPLSFLGSIGYGILAVTQTDINSVIVNKNWVFAMNVFIGLCGLLSLASWFNTDISVVDGVTTLIDLNANLTRDNIDKSND